MRERAVLHEPAFLVLLVLAGCTGGPKPSLVPPQTVEIDARTLREFQEEVEKYAELRKKVLAEIPAVTNKSTAAGLVAYQRALTSAIVAERSGKKQGEIFEPAVEAAMRRTLEREFSGPDGPALITEIKKGNPEPEDPTLSREPVTVAVNAVYTEAAQVSSVPPSLLLKLPLLPEQLRYRFVGRALILGDTEANVILDFIDGVVPDPSIPR